MSLEDIERAIKDLLTIKIVACPTVPVEITGITAADALDSGDCMGNVMTIAVPKMGILYSATYFDLDDEGLQVDFEVFKNPIVQVASDSAFAPSDAEMVSFVAELSFVSFDDAGGAQTSTLPNVGIAYTAPSGFLYVQAVARGALSLAVGNMPRFQMQIISYDPNWKG